MLNLTVSQAIEGFFLDRRVSLKQTTIENYQFALAKLRANFPNDPPLASITPRDIAVMLDRLGTEPRQPGGIIHKPAKPLSQKSVLNVHTILSALWRWAVNEGYVERNIMSRVETPRAEERVIAPFTLEDVTKMLAACDRSKEYERDGKVCSHARVTALRDRAIVMLLVDTGIRASELCELHIEHLDMGNSRIKIFGKGAKERLVSVGTRTSKAIWRYLATRPDDHPVDPLFVYPGGLDPLDRRVLHQLIQRLGERAGVSPAAHPHRFRHTFAINYLRNGGDVFTLKALLGHSSLTMVQRYLAIAQADTAAAHKRASPVDNWRL